MKIRYLISIALVLVTINTFSQQINENPLFSIRIGHCRYSTGFHIPDYKVFNIKFDANYSLAQYLDMGVYFGYSPRNFKKGYPHTLFYGVNLTLKPLSFFQKEGDKLRLEPYFSGKFGGYNWYDLSLFDEGFNPDYLISLGLGYYPFKKVGVFSEYDVLSKTATKSFYTRFRYGVIFKF